MIRYALVTAGFLAAGVSAMGESPYEVGKRVPELTLPAIADGRPLSLADFRGRKLMLHVWASW